MAAASSSWVLNLLRSLEDAVDDIRPLEDGEPDCEDEESQLLDATRLYDELASSSSIIADAFVISLKAASRSSSCCLFSSLELPRSWIPVATSASSAASRRSSCWLLM
jgi:hypothetical protein